MKFLNKFYNNADDPWVTLTWSRFYSNNQTPPQARSPVGSFRWKDIMKLFDKFQSLVVCNPNRRNTTLFWSDIWVDQTMKDKFPQLFSFTRKPKCPVRFFLNQEIGRIFSLPLSQQAAAQLEEIQQLMQVRTWDESISDAWSYNWGSSRYRSKKTYNILIGTTSASPSSNGCGLQATWAIKIFSSGCS